MMGFLWNLGAFLLALGILIAVHEFGHFWVARRCGVYVERFSIGFGKAIWQRKGKDGTEYTLAMIPLGGYVKMLDERVEAVPEHQRHMAFNNKKLWQRSAIVAAGPFANFVFAVFAYWVVYLIGVPAVKPVIGEVAPQSIAAQGGIAPGMELKSISGIETPDWESVNMAMISHIGDKQMAVTLTEPHSNVDVKRTLNLTDWSYDPERENVLTTLGLTPYTPAITLVISQLVDNGAAINAGFQLNDKIIAVDGEPIKQWQTFADLVKANPGKTLNVEVLRDNAPLTLALTPAVKDLKDGSKVGYVGIAPKVDAWPEDYRINLQFGPIESVAKATEKTWQLVTLTFDMVTKLVTGDVAIKNLSGPISIAKGAGMTADFGLVYFLGFLALISVNLGIVNLLPLPVLDGGHLMFFAIEAVTRRPVSEKIQDIGYRVGSAILVALMAIALFNDFTRL
ncbi:TPA: sigma E protease regulator RseP [Photobacterium damselae]|uniref:Zinc metalloprotease n=1 Tax=Photobacterium damselae subsp. damselae TaxID=85581 RepID=A0AAD3WYV8_PHODD|nr:sigma E protease regulator RseP [Photobacterium damselae]KAB1178291.1 sigma E protease regulator RseP [Photobacterium damselae subsp. damselae]KAB1185867.1 sigma E protease regulator RseP [Photobacterium damselae subsp. damselae]MBF7100648.1 sigma E protease regulator RseP [Photobacterium damselae]MCG3817182.1 sigma E protease regulator RseP [Photobacterium damselae]PSB88986.1 zinc metallopeptidase RseP [Photobacterium damselae subsp. damselae]